MQNSTTNHSESVLLILTLPYGDSCRIRMHRQDTASDLISRLISEGRLRPGRYSLILEGSGSINAFTALSQLLDRDVTEARGEVVLQLSRIRVQRLYGCPTAVTEQAEQLAGCTVTRTPL